MRTKIDVYELAYKLSEIYGCKFVVFEDGGLHDADGKVLIHLSDIKPIWVRDCDLIEINNYWLVINGRQLLVDFEFVDISEEYTTNGVIDFSKCMFEFL